MQDAYLAAVKSEIEAIVGEKIALEVELGIQLNANQLSPATEMPSRLAINAAAVSTGTGPAAISLSQPSPSLLLSADMLEAMVRCTSPSLLIQRPLR